MSQEAFCNSWICRNKPKQKCAELEVNIDEEELEGIVYINFCSQCLTDALEEFE
jgi:hypothetical protein